MFDLPMISGALAAAILSLTGPGAVEPEPPAPPAPVTTVAPEPVVVATTVPPTMDVLCSSELGEGGFAGTSCPEGWTQHGDPQPPPTWTPHVAPEGEPVLCTLAGDLGQTALTAEACVRVGGTVG